MKQVNLLSGLALLFVISSALSISCSLSSAPASTNSPVHRVYVASSPCSDATKSFLIIPFGTECELIKWNLTLYQNPKTLAPTDYKLAIAYGISQPGTPGLIGGGTAISVEGNWTVRKYIIAGQEEIVYRLNTGRSRIPISFLKLDTNHLHLLDQDNHLMIGNDAWSYTLNRIKK